MSCYDTTKLFDRLRVKQLNEYLDSEEPTKPNHKNIKLVKPEEPYARKYPANKLVHRP